MDRKILSIILGIALIVSFFLPMFSGVLNFSAFEMVKAPSGGGLDFEMTIYKYVWVLVPLSGVMLIVGALNNNQYILGRGLWAILPLLAVLYYIIRPLMESNSNIGDMVKRFGIGMWLAVAASLILAFYWPKQKA